MTERGSPDDTQGTGPSPARAGTGAASARHRRFRALLLAGLLPASALVACEGGSPEAPAAEPQASGERSPEPVPSTVLARGRQHLLVTVALSEDGARVLDARRVDAPLPRSRPPVGARWHVEVVDGGGRRLFATDVAPADSVTGEFPGPDGTLERVDARQDTSVFALRVPVLAEAEAIAISAPSLALHPSDRRRRGGATPDDDVVVPLGRVAYPREAP